MKLFLSVERERGPMGVGEEYHGAWIDPARNSTFAINRARVLFHDHPHAKNGVAVFTSMHLHILKWRLLCSLLGSAIPFHSSLLCCMP